jgi:hypothetical protein
LHHPAVICEDVYILAEGRDIFVGRIVDIILELAEV